MKKTILLCFILIGLVQIAGAIEHPVLTDLYSQRPIYKKWPVLIEELGVPGFTNWSREDYYIYRRHGYFYNTELTIRRRDGFINLEYVFGELGVNEGFDKTISEDIEKTGYIIRQQYPNFFINFSKYSRGYRTIFTVLLLEGPATFAFLTSKDIIYTLNK